MKTMDEKATTANEIRKGIRQAEEIKSRMRHLTVEREKIAAAQRKESDLVTYWRGTVEHFREEFVSDLMSRSSGGRIPHIKFDSPAAVAFINAEQWLAVIPDLAARVSGGRSASDCLANLKRIDDELGQLQQEFSRLGIS